MYVRADKPKNTKAAAVLLSVLVLAAMLYGVMQYRAYAARTITVTFQGEKYKVPTGSTPDDLLSQATTNTLQYYGDLLAVDGTVFEKSKGGGPKYTVYDRAILGSSKLNAGDTVVVSRGDDRTEEGILTTQQIRAGFTRTGKGPIPVLITPGKNGLSEVVMGKLSSLVASQTVVLEPVNAVLDYKEYRNEADKVIVLTFDDGPREGSTQKIVNALRAAGVKGTFFMLAKNVERNPALAKMVTDAGNEVGIHSSSHRLMTKQSNAQIEKEIKASTKRILEATGKTPTWIRPPYGAVDGQVYTALHSHNLNVALWSIDTQDWKRPGTAAIVKRATKGLPGAVILMHDGGGNRDQTAEALPAIVTFYKNAGYRFVTLSEYQASIDSAEKK